MDIHTHRQKDGKSPQVTGIWANGLSLTLGCTSEKLKGFKQKRESKRSLKLILIKNKQLMLVCIRHCILSTHISSGSGVIPEIVEWILDIVSNVRDIDQNCMI